MKITIVHLTRMRAPSICVAGVDGDGRSIRPVPQRGNLHRSRLRGNRGPFALGAVVDLGRTEPRPVAPEVEDVVVDPGRLQFVGALCGRDFRELLDATAKDSLREVFGVELTGLSRTAAAVPRGSGSASLGVIRVARPVVVLNRPADRWDLRLRFHDADLGDICIKVTDIRLWCPDHVTPDEQRIGELRSQLARCDDCFLAMGLTRPFRADAYDGERHWLQVNNVFPPANPLWTRGEGP